MLGLCNFSEHAQQVSGNILNTIEHKPARDLLSDSKLTGHEQVISLRPYQLSWWLI